MIFPVVVRGEEEKKEYIKWVDFKVTSEIIRKAIEIDIATKNEEIHVDFVTLISLSALKNGGDFKDTKSDKVDELAKEIKKGKPIAEMVKNNEKYYNYYHDAYSAVLGGFVGEYEAENAEGTMEQKYGVKVFSPIAKKFPYIHYEDFGAGRSFGFKRTHLGNDLLGQVGTPVVAVESGTVEALGWNKYGGWRIGIRSADAKRYYYYAHLRKGYPYKLGLKEGDHVEAGDVIGYLGRSGYSDSEDKNNISTPHLHFGMQLIFDESQKESNNEIWIDVYQIIEFLENYRSETEKIDVETKDYARVSKFRDLSSWS
ncbi:MAG: M23 family metallopeptidase [Oscillospiraceae bacterium]